MINIDLEETTANMEVLYQELQTKYADLEEKYADLKEKYAGIKEKYNSLLQEHEIVKQNKSKAGRRPNDEKWTAKLKAFSAMKDEGAKREEIQEKLNMSRATYFRFNKIYSDGKLSSEESNDSVHAAEEILERAEEALKEHSEGLVLDPDTGEYVTPEGLKRRRKLAEIRARRAAEEEQNKAGVQE